MNIFAMKAIPSSKIVPMKIRLLPDTMETESEAWAIGTNESAKRISVLVSGKGGWEGMGFEKAYTLDNETCQYEASIYSF